MPRKPRPSSAAQSGRSLVWRLVFLLPVLAALLSGMTGGLVRAGNAWTGTAPDWLGPAVLQHAFLMICCFLASVIGLERAVALRHRLAFVGPAASALAGLALLAGAPGPAAWLVVLASLAFVGVSLVILQRQYAAHTLLLLLAALAWFAGSLCHALTAATGAVVPLWFAFLVLTIAAERLEMTRLMRRQAASAATLYGLLALMLLGAVASAWSGPAGGVIYGLALSGLALWLMVFDIARRTVRAQGLSRYMAICLLLGYLWLFLAGLAWAATACGLPWRDAALHGLALGFVFSMMLGHAPVILPAIARVKLLYGPWFYLPLLLLHGSLAWRLSGGGGLPRGAVGNAIAILAFAATVLGSALAWRLRPSASLPAEHHGLVDP